MPHGRPVYALRKHLSPHLRPCGERTGPSTALHHPVVGCTKRAVSTAQEGVSPAGSVLSTCGGPEHGAVASMAPPRPGLGVTDSLDIAAPLRDRAILCPGNDGPESWDLSPTLAQRPDTAE